MATVTSSGAGSDDVARSDVGITAATETYTFATSGDGTAAGDVIQMIKVPAGARILDVILACDDVDTNGTPTIVLDVGDGGDTDRFIDGSTVGQTGGVSRMNSAVGADYTYTADDTIDIRLDAAAATKAAGDVHLTVLYSTSGT